MTTLGYDGSFSGFLSAVFWCYDRKLAEVSISESSKAEASLFGEHYDVPTDEAQAARVWKGLKGKLSRTATNAVFQAFLSEEQGMEDRLLQYIRYAFASTANMERDFSHPAVVYVQSMAKKVHREKHRMEAFVRFKEAADGLFFATIEPDFNVVPLIADHFEKRYADQRWLIYDLRRRYGIYYDKHTVEQVTLTELPERGIPAELLDGKEEMYKTLWQHYFESVNIPARKNPKLHLQHMPRRYWKYLPEKQKGL